MPDHQPAKLLRIDEDDTATYLSRRIHGTFCEARGRNEYALLRLLQTQRAEKLPDSARTNKIAITIPFGLDVDLIDTEWILVNDAINAIIT